MISTPVSYVAAVVNALVLLACVAYFGWRGYHHGVLRTLQRLISMVSGYVACYVLAATVAGFFKTAFGLSMGVSYLLSAALLLFGVAFMVNLLLSHHISRLEAANDGAEEEADLDPDMDDSDFEPPVHKAGLAVGVLVGTFLGLLTVWLAGITVDAMALHSEGSATVVARTADPVRKMAGAMVGGAVAYAVEQKTGQQSLASDVTARLIADPVVTTQQLVEVSKSVEFKQFFSDPEVRLLMQENNIDALQSHPAFQRLMTTAQTRAFLDVLGVTVKNNADLSAEARSAQLLSDMYQKARRIQNNPRFIALSQKPEFQQLLHNPSPVALLTNPMVQELGDIVFSDKAPIKRVGNNAIIVEGSEQSFEALPKAQWQSLPASDATPGTADAETEAPAAEEGNVIYRWTDEYGQKHFSQTRPEGNYPLEVIKSQ